MMINDYLEGNYRTDDEANHGRHAVRRPAPARSVLATCATICEYAGRSPPHYQGLGGNGEQYGGVTTTG